MQTRIETEEQRHSRRVFMDATIQAAARHRHQVRKGTDIPYVSHLLAVAALVLEFARTVGLVRHVLRQRRGLTQIVDGQWAPVERVDLGAQQRLQSACVDALWKQRQAAAAIADATEP